MCFTKKESLNQYCRSSVRVPCDKKEFKFFYRSISVHVLDSTLVVNSKKKLGFDLGIMGFLFSKLWSYFGNEEHKIIIVGLDNAGKTTILYQFLMNEVVHTSPTIGSNVEEVVWKNIHFLMWYVWILLFLIIFLDLLVFWSSFFVLFE